jgi:hypothetical protein
MRSTRSTARALGRRALQLASGGAPLVRIFVQRVQGLMPPTTGFVVLLLVFLCAPGRHSSYSYSFCIRTIYRSPPDGRPLAARRFDSLAPIVRRDA